MYTLRNYFCVKIILILVIFFLFCTKKIQSFELTEIILMNQFRTEIIVYGNYSDVYGNYSVTSNFLDENYSVVDVIFIHMIYMEKSPLHGSLIRHNTNDSSL